MIYKIGLTGTIGSGKTTVSTLFSELGVAVFSADKIARQLSLKDQPAYLAILHEFGEHILDVQGQINREQLGNIVFKNSDLKAKLENILHPMIMRKLHQSAEAQDSAYCILDIPLLVNTVEQDKVDRILVIKSKLTTRIERIKQRNGWSDEKIALVMNAQASEQALLNAADDVLENEGEISNLMPKVKNLHQSYLKLALGQK